MKSDSLKVLGKRLKACRSEKKMTQAQIAAILHVSKSLISKIENGKARVPVIVLISYCNVIGLHAFEIVKEMEVAVPSLINQPIC